MYESLTPFNHRKSVRKSESNKQPSTNYPQLASSEIGSESDLDERISHVDQVWSNNFSCVKPCVCFYDRNLLDINYGDIDMTKVVHQKVFLCDGCCVKKIRNFNGNELPPPSKTLYVDEQCGEQDGRGSRRGSSENRNGGEEYIYVDNEVRVENGIFVENVVSPKKDIDMTNVVHPKDEKVERRTFQRASQRDSYRSLPRASVRSNHFDRVSMDSGVYDEMISENEVEQEMEELKSKVVLGKLGVWWTNDPCGF